MHPSLVRRVVYPLYDLLASRHIISCFGSLGRSQWLSADALETLQTEKLRQLLSQATANVPFYQRHLGEAGVRSEAISGTADLRTIPPHDRTTLVAQHDDFIPRHRDSKS